MNKNELGAHVSVNFAGATAVARRKFLPKQYQKNTNTFFIFLCIASYKRDPMLVLVFTALDTYAQEFLLV